MIYIQDDFLPDIILNKIEEYLVNFREVNVGDKKFWVMDAEEPFVKWVLGYIGNIEGVNIENVLSFFRIATDKVDNTWRIHNDSIINGQQPDRALVLYLSDTELSCMHGTAFWEHKEHGDKLLKEKLTNEEFDRLLKEDSEDLTKWNLKTIIGYKKNRLLSYPCNYFHSKYPNMAWESGRKVFVMFYKVN